MAIAVADQGVRPAPTPAVRPESDPRLVIDAVGLGRRFGPVVAVADVSVQVPRGSVLALLGPNGAGKTTTLQLLAGLLPPTAGRATVAGYDIVQAADHVRRRVGLMVDEPGFYPEMRIEEYLLFVARLYCLPTRESRQRIAELLDRFDLAAKRRARLGTLSKGMRQKVALLRAVVHRPPVLLLDEPTSALDPLSAQAVHQFIAERRAAGDAIIVSTHNLPEAEALADRVAIMAAGRLRRQGTTAELCRAPDGRDAFVLTLRDQAARPALALVQGVPGLRDVTVCASTGGRYEVRYRTATPDQTNAVLTTTLAAHGAAIVALTPQARRLQAVYLDTIREATSPCLLVC